MNTFDADKYDAACQRACTAQGLDPVMDTLNREGLEPFLWQSGGFCMVVVCQNKEREAWITAEGTDTNGETCEGELYMLGLYTKAGLENSTEGESYVILPLGKLAGAIRNWLG